MLIASTSKLIPNSEEEPIDPRDFQAGIDDSVKNVYNLVDSWIPTDLGPEWGPSSSSNGKTFGSGFEFKARPPGLGLGASAGAIHAQNAADHKLKSQLLNSKKRAREVEDNKLISNGINGKDKAVEEDSEEEEDSRSKTVAKINSKSSKLDPFSHKESSKIIKKSKNGRQASPPPPITPISKPITSILKSSSSQTPSASAIIPPVTMNGSVPSPTLANGVLPTPPKKLTKKEKKSQAEELAQCQLSASLHHNKSLASLNEMNSTSEDSEMETTPAKVLDKNSSSPMDVGLKSSLGIRAPISESEPELESNSMEKELEVTKVLEEKVEEKVTSSSRSRRNKAKNNKKKAKKEAAAAKQS